MKFYVPFLIVWLLKNFAYSQTNFTASWNFENTTNGSIDNPNVSIGGANLVNVQEAGYPGGAISIRLWSIAGFDGSKYVEVSVSPLNYGYSVASLSFTVNRSDQGPTELRVRSSRDNFASDISAVGLSTNFSNVSVPLNTGNIEEGVSFRIYGYNAGSHLGVMRLDNMRINGTVSLIPLPVEYTYFRGRTYQSQVELSWQTAWERNASHFEVQRSTDLKEFITLHTIQAIGETQQKSTYSFTDATPLPSINYYRLRQIDKDGTAHYSKNIAVLVNPDEPQIWVYENPTSTIKVRLVNLQPADVQLFDAIGQSIPIQWQALSATDYMLKAASIQGVYWLVAFKDQKRISQKVVVTE